MARSTAMWDADPVSARSAIARHDEIIEDAGTGRGGTLLKSRGEGDGHFAVFDHAQAEPRAAGSSWRRPSAPPSPSAR